MTKFELIDKYKNQTDLLPSRATEFSAGYDFKVAEDIIIPSYDKFMLNLISNSMSIDSISEMISGEIRDISRPLTLNEVANFTKITQAKPSLIPTGVKCKLPSDKYLHLVVRSSLPLKHWLVLANGGGIIDSDYYGNSNNDGHIFFQLINLSPWDIQLKRGDRIGQGIILPYYITDDDEASGRRTGGFGSTSK